MFRFSFVSPWRRHAGAFYGALLESAESILRTPAGRP